MCKFSDGDLLIHRFRERQTIDPLMYFEVVTGLQQGEYFLSDYGTIDIKQAEREYVKVTDVLWQHYILDTTTNKLTPYNSPMTIEEARDLYAPSKTTDKILLTAYWEGFRIPIEMEFVEDDVLVRKSDAGRSLEDNDKYLPKVVETNQSEEIYYLSNGIAVSFKTAHDVYLDAFDDNVLWYWEFKTDGDWSMPTSTRKSFQETLEITSIDGKSVTERRILYSLGFSIKE
jgi:hypothetical protein